MTEKYIFADYALAKDRMNLRAATAVCWTAVTWPLSYKAYEKFNGAWTFYKQGRHLEELAAKNTNTEMAQEKIIFAKANYDAAYREGLPGIGYALIVALPLALLIKSFFKNLRLKRKFDQLNNNEKNEIEVGKTIDSMFEKK